MEVEVLRKVEEKRREMERFGMGKLVLPDLMFNAKPLITHSIPEPNPNLVWFNCRSSTWWLVLRRHTKS